MVLHEHEIRKPVDAYLILKNKEVRERFQARLSAYMEALPVTVIAVVIDKPAYAERYHHPVNPYDYALEAGLERVYRHLEELGQGDTTTPVIVERRGGREDAELELAFLRVCAGSNILGRKLPCHLVMIPKSSNCAGLQLADLMARPIGLKHLRPEQPNRAYEVIGTKLRRGPKGQIRGWGLKILP